MTVLRRIHLILGLLTIVAFVLTGQYMDRVHGHLGSMDPLPRMLFRSGHIYLLFSGLLNCLLGMTEMLKADLWRKVVAGIGSLALLVTPAFFLIGFFREPWMEGLNRPFARLAIYLSLAGVIFHLLAHTTFSSRRMEKQRGVTS